MGSYYLVGINALFCYAKYKKIVGLYFEEFDKVFFHDIHTDIPRAIYKTLPSGVQNQSNSRIRIDQVGEC